MRVLTTLSQSRRPRLLVAAGIGLVLVAALVLGAMRLVSAGPARVTAVRVPPEELSIIVDAAASCPVLSPAKLAGQIMEASGFSANGDARRDLGIAGLTDPIWNVWQPSPGASRSSARESILGLAHYMCDLIGHVRAAKIAGDPWQLGLGAHHSGLAEVLRSAGVPEAARSYVEQVAHYAAWYERQPEFRAVSAVPDPTPTTDAQPSPSNTPAPATTTSPPTPSPSTSSPTPVSTVPAPAVVRYEAEDAATYQCTIDSNFTGYSGTGFVNTLTVGSYVRWTITAAGAGIATVTIRYANAYGDRPVDVAVNGSVVAAKMRFGVTGSWNTWANQIFTVAVEAGSNDILVTATTVNGTANIDYLNFASP